MIKNPYASLKELYERELSIQNVSYDKINIVLNLIKEGCRDADLNRMDDDYRATLESIGVLEAFDEISNKYGIKWRYSSEHELY